LALILSIFERLVCYEDMEETKPVTLPAQTKIRLIGERFENKGPNRWWGDSDCCLKFKRLDTGDIIYIITTGENGNYILRPEGGMVLAQWQDDYENPHVNLFENITIWGS